MKVNIYLNCPCMYIFRAYLFILLVCNTCYLFKIKYTNHFLENFLMIRKNSIIIIKLVSKKI